VTEQHTCDIAPPPWDIVLAAWTQIATADINDDAVDAGDLAAKSGTLWLKRHGYILRIEGYAILSGKGRRAITPQIEAEYRECVADRPGVHPD
jgi:hypothetical protein